MCFPSQYTDVMILNHLYGQETDQTGGNIGYDAAEKPMPYRIEWTRGHVQVFANNRLVGTLKDANFLLIPDCPLRIHIFIYPQQAKLKRKPEGKRLAKLTIYRAIFKQIEYNDNGDHTELFVN